MEDVKKYIIDRKATVKEALIRLDKLSDNVLTLFVLDEKKMVGTLTDGDVRRALIRNVSLDTSVEQVMNRSFRYICPNEKNIQKIQCFRKTGIELLPCIDEMGQIISVYNLKHKKSVLPISAVLMAGGKGERLRPLTQNIPKPLLKVGEKAIIDYNVENLISYGIDNIFVTTNYLAEQIEEHFNNERQEVTVHCVREKDFLGTLASVKLITGIKNDEVLVMNSDLFTNINLEDFYCHFMEKNADMSAAAIPYSINVPYGVFDLEGNNIRAIIEKPTYNYYANAGIYLIKKSLLEIIPDGSFYNATDFMTLLMSIGKTVIRYPLVGYWIDIGKKEDYQKAQDFVKHIRDSND